MQVIDIHRQAVVDALALDDCHLLQRALEEHGTYVMNGCFHELPIHQACYKLNKDTSSVDIINSYFHSIQDNNDPTLLEVDVMGMTPLHILCANPVTKDMIKQLYIKNTEAAAVRNVNYLLPWHMYVINKDERFCMFAENENGITICYSK